MKDNLPITPASRTFCAILGGFTGTIYGLFLATFIGYFFTNRFSFGVVGWCGGAFAVLGIFYENVVVEAFIALLHFLYGLVNGFAENVDFEPERDAQSHLRAIVLIGLVTGFAIMFALAW